MLYNYHYFDVDNVNNDDFNIIETLLLYDSQTPFKFNELELI